MSREALDSVVVTQAADNLRRLNQRVQQLESLPQRYDFVAAADPGVNDDQTEGYSLFSLGYNTTSGDVFVLLDPTTGAANWFNLGSGGATNLSNTPDADSVDVDSSTGTGTTIAAATESLAGVLTAAMVTKLFRIGKSVRVYNNASISIANNQTSPIAILTYNSERRDDLGAHSTSVNTSRLTAPWTGWYDIGSNTAFAANSTGVRHVYFLLDGTTQIGQDTRNAASSAATVIPLNTKYYLTAGQHVEVQVYQNSGGSLDVSALGNRSPEFWMTYLGDGQDASAPTYATIAFRSFAAANQAASLTVVPAKPSGLAAGDLMVASVFIDSASNTVSPPAGWLTAEYTADGGMGLYTFYKIASSGDAAASNFTFTASASDGLVAVLSAWTGVDETTPVGDSTPNTDNTGTNNAPTGLSVTSTIDNSMLIYSGAHQSGAADFGAISGWSQVPEEDLSSSPFGSVTQFYKTLATAGASGNVVGSIDSAQQWHVHLLVLNPAEV